MAIEVAQISGDTVELLFNPDEEPLRISENLAINDQQDGRGIVVQVIALKLLPPLTNGPSRPRGARPPRQSPSAATAIAASPHRTKALSSQRSFSARAMAVAKIRRMIDSHWRLWDGWIPQRHMTVTRITDHEVLQRCAEPSGRPLRLGKTLGGADVHIDDALIGHVNLLVGTSQREIAPLTMHLVDALIAAGTLCVIFATRGSYTLSAVEQPGCSPRTIPPARLIHLVPGENLKLGVSQLGPAGIVALLTRFGLPAAAALYFASHVARHEARAKTMDPPPASSDFLGMPALLDIAHALEAGGETIIGGAIVSCLESIRQTRIIADAAAETTSFVESYTRLHQGGAIVIDVSPVAPQARPGLVQVVVQLVEQLSASEVTPALQRPPCLFFDEAQALITRRLLADILALGHRRGMASFFIADMASDLDTALIHRVDHLFIQRLASEQDGQRLARTGLIDAETLQTLARRLPKQHGLVVGSATAGYPIVFTTDPASIQAETDRRESQLDTSANVSQPVISVRGTRLTAAEPKVALGQEPDLPLFPQDTPTLIAQQALHSRQDQPMSLPSSQPTLAQVSAMWDHIVKRVSRRRRILETILSTARPLRLTDQHVVLGLPPQQKFQQELIESEEYRRVIEEELQKTFGVALEVTTALDPA